jgi:hypothetical protein
MHVRGESDAPNKASFRSDGLTTTDNFLIRNDGYVGIGMPTGSINGRLHIRGAGATASTTSLKVENSVGIEVLKVSDLATTGLVVAPSSIERETLSVGGPGAGLVVIGQTPIGTGQIGGIGVHGTLSSTGFTLAKNNNTTDVILNVPTTNGVLMFREAGADRAQMTENTFNIRSKMKLGTTSNDITIPLSQLHTTSILNGTNSWSATFHDDTSHAQGVGGGIYFTGNTNGTTESKGFAAIRGVKSTGTVSEGEGDLAFYAGTLGNDEHMRIKNTGVINMGNLPTSSAGLVSGDIWNNSGVLSIV